MIVTGQSSASRSTYTDTTNLSSQALQVLDRVLATSE